MKILGLPNPAEHAISIRAKAHAFEDAKSKQLLQRVRLIAPSDATVLVTGESGTGKELIARLVHSLSDRKDGPFVPVNCGAFSESLIESELFGHERGAFTGAVEARQGWFEAADQGTLFLDEVGDLPLSAQVKLLRVLQEREIVRVGSRKSVKIDVRLVAATNVKLEAAVLAGNFREDLYYRLNVAKLALAPLRERPGDIVPLTHHFIDVYGKRLGIALPEISEGALNSLLAYSWPGNIRELENVIHHALLISRGQRIEAADLTFSPLGARTASSASPSPGRPAAYAAYAADAAPSDRAAVFNDAQAVEEALRPVLAELFDRNVPDLWQHIEAAVFGLAYEHCDRNQVHTGRLLSLTRNIIRNRLHQLGLSKTAGAGMKQQAIYRVS